MKPNIFHPYETTFHISYLPSFKLTCDTNRIYGYGAMWFLQVQMKSQAATFVNSWIVLCEKLSRKHQEEGRLITHCEVVNYLLEMYVVDDVMAETDAAIMRLTQPPNKTLIAYAELLLARAFRCKLLYDD